LASSFERVASGIWFYIEFGPVTTTSDAVKTVAEDLLLEFASQGVLGVRCTRRKRIAGEPYLGCLYFKIASKRDNVLNLLLQEKDKRALKTVRGSTADGVPQPYAAQRDLIFVDEVYASAGSEHEREALLACGPTPMMTPEDFKMQFLDYVRYAPRVPTNIKQFPPANIDSRKRKMQVLEFTTSWLMDKIDRLRDPPIELKRLQILVRTHGRNGFKKHFIAPIWPSSGPINKFIRQIARWADDDGLKQNEVRIEPRESIGFTLHKSWRVTLEMALPEPYFLKDPQEGMVANAVKQTDATLSSFSVIR
jgi:hypothetical protein